MEVVFGSGGSSSGGSCCIAMQTASPIMDSRIWRRLPQKLLDRVVAFLPPPAFFRARSVCRRWYALLFSDAFLEMHLRLSPRCRWLFFFEHDLPKSYVYAGAETSAAGGVGEGTGGRWRPPCYGFMFDPDEGTWRRVSFAGVVPPGFYPAASSGGLLCWVSDGAGTKNLVLCNPLSKLTAQLLPTPRPRLFPSVGLTVSDASLAVMLAGDDLISPFAVKNLTAERFHVDSTTGFYTPWVAAAPLPRLCNLESGRMVFKEGRFYCMNYSPFSVLAYDVATDEWSKLQAPMKRFLRSPSLVEFDGKVVLVAAVEKSKLAVPRSVRLWGLQPGGRAWAELERMPPQVHAQFVEAEGGRGFEGVGNGSLLAITIRGSNDVLLFDGNRRVWRWLPPCPFLQMGGGDVLLRGGLRGFPFEPRLATPAVGLLQSSAFPFQA
ncbi:hypothetical protein Taro_006501 [Colocasia esculenta]|uniref:F-box domain-containing protein n=1 Tax=Colocasia esculenta TaxID=4460 RepID=A0A843TSU5_COLES|nr:hypothetical protein [Colocasia esculenta]